MGITISPWMMAFLMLMTGFAGFVDSAAGGGGLISLPAYLFADVYKRQEHILSEQTLEKIRESALRNDAAHPQAK